MEFDPPDYWGIKFSKFTRSERTRLDNIAKKVYEKAMQNIERNYGVNTYINQDERLRFMKDVACNYVLDDDEFEYVVQKANRGG